MQSPSSSLSFHPNIEHQETSTGLELYRSLLKTAQWLSLNRSKQDDDVVESLAGGFRAMQESNSNEPMQMIHQPLCLEAKNSNTAIQNGISGCERGAPKEVDIELNIETDPSKNRPEDAPSERSQCCSFFAEEMRDHSICQGGKTNKKDCFRSKNIEEVERSYSLTTKEDYTHHMSLSRDASDENLRREKKGTSRDMTNLLKTWLYEHRKNPYPTKEEKVMLSLVTRMNLTQVSTWFANARRRLKKDNQMTWHARNRMISEHDPWKDKSVFETLSGCARKTTYNISKDSMFTQPLSNTSHISSCGASKLQSSINDPISNHLQSEFVELRHQAERHNPTNSEQFLTSNPDRRALDNSQLNALMTDQVKKEYFDFFCQWMNYYLLTYLNSNVEGDRSLDTSISSRTAQSFIELLQNRSLSKEQCNQINENLVTTNTRRTTESNLLQKNKFETYSDNNSEGTNQYSHIKDDFRKIEALLQPISVSNVYE